MVRNGFIGLIISFALLAALYGVVQGVLPGLIRRNIESTIHGLCESCTISVEDVGVVLFPLRFTFKEVHLEGGDPKSLAADVHIARISGQIALAELLHEEIRVTDLRIERPDVLLTEGNLKVPDSTPSKSEKKWRYNISSTEVREGHFVYKRAYEPGDALLHFNAISARMSSFGNGDLVIEHQVTAAARGRLENSGHFNLAIYAFPFSKQTKVGLDVQIEDQNLGDVSPFFESGDGVKTEGSLLKGRGVVHIAGDQLEATAEVRYNRLKIHVEKSRDRGAAASFFANLVQSVELRSSDLDQKRSDQTKKVELKRNPDESLVGFIIRGLKTAVLKIATR